MRLYFRTLNDVLHHGVWIRLVTDYLIEHWIQTLRKMIFHCRLNQPLLQQCQQPLAGALPFLFQADAARFKVLCAAIYSYSNLFNTSWLRRHSLDHDWIPSIRPVGKREQRVQRSLHLLNTRPIALVDDKYVANFHEAGFQRLDVVAHARNKHDDAYIRKLDDIDLVLPDTHGFHQYWV